MTQIKFEAKWIKRPEGWVIPPPEFRARANMTIFRPNKSQPNQKWQQSTETGEWFYFTLKYGVELKFTSSAIDWKTLGQFIGQYDQDKKKIYQGDKLEVNEYRDFECGIVKEKLVGVVEYWDIFGAWHFVYGEKGKGLQILQNINSVQELSICADRSKIVGSIY